MGAAVLGRARRRDAGTQGGSALEELLRRLPLEQTLNVDETGHKENGDKFWTWVFRADLYVLFRIDKSRGSKVLLDVLGEASFFCLRQCPPLPWRRPQEKTGGSAARWPC